MSDRLAIVANDLVELIEKQPEPRLRWLAVRIAEFVAARSRLADPRLDAGLATLRAGDVGETEVRARLSKLVRELDKVAWDVQDAARAGKATDHDYLVAFARARAASAVWFALDADALTAATEAAYEAQAAVGDIAMIRTEILSAILARN